MINYIYSETHVGDWVKYFISRGRSPKDYHFLKIIRKEAFPPIFDYDELPILVMDNSGGIYMVSWNLDEMVCDSDNLCKKLYWVKMLNPVAVKVRKLY